MATHNAMMDLCRLLCCNFLYEAVVKLPNGVYLGRAPGEVSYNGFMGPPAPPRPGPFRDNVLAVWRALPQERRDAMLLLAANPPDGVPINLAEEFGVPVLEPVEV